jgi:hypothetical protein
MENSTNPLAKYTRQPKLFIDLPSKGNAYPSGALDKVEELEVYSMTANDEIAIKTPDGLFSGKATMGVIQNCVPSIKDANFITNRDLDYILAAIRIASYGDSISLTKVCESCENEDTFAFPLQQLLDHLTAAELVYETTVNEFKFKIRPLYYKEIVSNQQESVKLRRHLNQILSKLEDANERAEQIDLIYEQINEQTKNVICSVVTEVTTPDGTSETNHLFIKDFILNNESDFYNTIQDLYAKNAKALEIPAATVECSNCNKEQSIQPNLDYSSFFSKR